MKRVYDVILENVLAVLLLLILFAIFGLLKSLGYITVPWWFIFAPIACVLVATVLGLIVGMVLWCYRKIING